MSILHALVLGIVQGITQFLPVSGGGHNVLVPYAFGWQMPNAAFDVAVHAGALAALIYVFRERIAELFRALQKPDEPNRALLRLIAIGTIPTAVAGIALSSFVEHSLHRPVLIALLLGVTGWSLVHGERIATEQEERIAENAQRRLVAERIGEESPEPMTLKEETDMEPTDAAIIGTAQAFAVLPGISRTAATVTAGLHRGLSRAAAVRFSFLLAIPTLAGALILRLPDLSKPAARAGGAGVILIAAVTSAIAGVFAIRMFMKVIAKRGLKPFAMYCFLATAAFLLTALARG